MIKNNYWDATGLFLTLSLLGIFMLAYSSCGKTPEQLNVMIFDAVKKQDSAAVSQLLAAGADANGRDDTNMPLIIFAAGTGNREIVKLLVDAGADINVQEETSGFSALSMSVYLDNIEMMQFIAQLGGDPNTVNKEGQTPLFIAAEKGNTELAKTLLKAGADPHFINKKKLNGATNTNILIAAVRSNNPETVQTIMDQGVDVNHPDEFGDPAVNYAAYRGNIEVIKILIKAGCNLNMVGYNNSTALDFAKRQGFPEAVKFLQQAGALTSDQVK